MENDMGMSTHVSGVRDLDGRFKQMINVKLACEAANIEYPREVNEYFLDYDPGCDVEDLERYMSEVAIENACTCDNYDATESYEVDITKLPEDITKVRFINSW
jgi:hypothetical protein